MRKKIEKIIEKFDAITRQLGSSLLTGDHKTYGELAKQHHNMESVAQKGREYLELLERIDEDKAILEGDDEELKSIVKEELEGLLGAQEQLEEELKILLIPKDPRDDKSTIVEIRGGTGGEEAAIFAADLYRMYSRYAERKNWTIEVLSSNETGSGGVKEIIFSLNGKGAFGEMKFEGGVHRVQRVPVTETSGRIHTSAATVAVLPQADEIDIEIDPNDLRIDTYRAQGAGGQHVNKTESAVRITHIPTGVVVTCQDEKSQHKNKTAAMKVLRSRLLALKEEKQRSEIDQARKSMVSTGDRSAKIRTYNFPQGRVTDHRIDLTLYKLQSIMDGDIDELIEQLRVADQLNRLNKEM